jgi:glycosyltransferase involved in cell wall biosynthesis
MTFVSEPLVSVIIPAYNGSPFIRQAIQSVLDQTYPHAEIIVVDDGSTDDTPQLVGAFGPRVTLIRQHNQGVAAARNAGLRAARGEFAAFLDQDDWWRPEKLAQQVTCFAADPDLGLVHTNVAHFDDTTSSYTGRLSPVEESSVLVGRTFDRLVLGNGIYNSSVMIRRALLDRVGYMNTDIPGNTIQDYDLWLRIARCASFAYLHDELAVFRLHANQGTWKRQAMLTDEIQLLERVVGPAGLLADPARRNRLAWLLDELGRVLIEAGEKAQARRVLWRLLRVRTSLRSVLLLLLAALPTTAARRLLESRAPRHKPSWTTGLRSDVT